MPSASKKQQKLFGLALSVKKGETPRSEVSDKILKIVDTMSKKDIEKYASTKHDNLPDKKIEEVIRTIVREVLNEEEYDYYKDYKAGSIDWETYQRLSKEFQRKSGSSSSYRKKRQPTVVDKVYFDIPYSKKDRYKNRFILKWSPNVKKWWSPVFDRSGPVYIHKELEPLIDKKTTSQNILRRIKTL